MVVAWEARKAAADLLVLQALRHGHIGLALELLLALVQVIEVGLAALANPLFSLVREHEVEAGAVPAEDHSAICAGVAAVEEAELLAAVFAHALLDHLVVEVGPDRLQLPRLLRLSGRQVTSDVTQEWLLSVEGEVLWAGIIGGILELHKGLILSKLTLCSLLWFAAC